MDHVKAQQVISDALDRLAVDREELTLAKEHCRECEECGAYVRAMLLVQRSPLPEPPEDAVERVMTAVRAEAQRTAVARARAIAKPVPEATLADAAGTVSPEPDAGPGPAKNFRELWERASAPRNRRALLAWAGAAAMLFVVAGWGALAGIRTILLPPETLEVTVLGTDSSDDAGQQFGQAAPEAGSSDRSGKSMLAAPGAAAARFIAIDGTVFTLVGPALGQTEADLEKVDRVRTALDGGGLPKNHDVFAGTSSDRIYLETNDGLLEFRMVTRTYEQRVYALQSGDIDGFGEWPTLPSTISAPSSETGEPVFEQHGSTESGSPTYVLKGRKAADGIAIGPNPNAPDPIAGCPEWTWWAPLE